MDTVAFVLAFLKSQSQGVWPCILFHSMINSFSASYAIKEAMLFTVITTILEIVTVLFLYHFFQKEKIHH